jgi:hypothetical protein
VVGWKELSERHSKFFDAMGNWDVKSDGDKAQAKIFKSIGFENFLQRSE